MLERDISRSRVKEALKIGKVIETYDNDQPFPSKLIFAFVEAVPLHIVVAKDPITDEC